MSAAMDLPAALQPWQPWLQVFDADIVGVLGELLVRLDPLVGRGSAQVPAMALATEGVGGIDLRGSYERLLLSEWALAQDAPEEFLRRAAGGEHLFLAPHRVQPRTDALIVVVFDAGPLQWGAPRLLQVALWILLARRAVAARARLAWGVAQQPGTLHPIDGDAAADGLQALLRARTQQVAAAGHWDAWREHLRAMPATSERWACTDRMDALQGFTHAALARLGLDEHLHVQIGSTAALRTLSLPPPASAAAARLLRGEFKAARLSAETLVSRHRFSRQARPWLGEDGRRVVVPLLRENAAFQVTLPQPKQRKPPTVRYPGWSRQARFLAGVMINKGFGGVVADADHLHFWNLPGMSRQRLADASAMTERPGVAQPMAAAWLHAGGRAPATLLLLDHARNLLHWTNGTGPTLVRTGVIALQQVDACHALFAYMDGARLVADLLDPAGNRSASLHAQVDRVPELAWLACSQHRWNLRAGVAWRAGTQYHCVLAESRPQEGGPWQLTLPEGWRPQGLVAGRDGGNGMRLLVLRADRRALLAVGRDGHELLHTAAHEIGSVGVSADGQRVAIVDLVGGLHVLGDGGRVPLLHVRGKVGGHD